MLFRSLPSPRRTSARPAGSSPMKLHRLPVLMEEGRCCRGVCHDMSAATRSTSVDRNLAWRVSPGAGSPTPTRHPFKGRGFDDDPVEKPVEAPGAREKAQGAPWPASGQTRATAGNRMLTPFARRSAGIADAPETPGCLGSGLASKPRPGRLAGRGGRFLRAPVASVV